jgi:hypothetical protein
MAQARSFGGMTGSRERTVRTIEVAPAPRRRRWRRRLVLVLALLAAYPLFVLGTTYTITLRSGLDGGRHGPCDAYRHCLASAIVAYSSSPRFVEWVTAAMEGDDRGASHRMDAHNNGVGVRLAAGAANWSSLFASVRAAVDGGTVLDETFVGASDRVVWLPAAQWRARWW